LVRYDAIVLGLGGMGSAAAAALARRGRRVLALERYGAGHDRGSSHGASRVIRQAYFEHPSYVPLLLEAYELWRRLERDAGVGLLTETGGLMVGRSDSAVVAGSLASARAWGLEHELLDAGDLGRRFPTFSPAEDVVAVLEPHAGFVRPEATVRAHLALAAARGADLRLDTEAVTWEAGNGHVRIRTAEGTFEADRLVLAAGAWAPALLGELGRPLAVERHLQVWFAPRGGAAPFATGRHPVWVWEAPDGTQAYGFPALPGEHDVKAAFFRRGSPAEPDRLERGVRPGETEALAGFLAPRIPALASAATRAVACMYTTTPDEHFVLGPHPAHPEVVLAGGFSGHGFKFVPVVGEIVADLVEAGATPRDIALFDPARLQTGGPSLTAR
jgi:sarcosine oxidase